MDTTYLTNEEQKQMNSNSNQNESEENLPQVVRENAYKGRQKRLNRIAELDSEWDIERLLEMSVSILALTGMAMVLVKHKGWLVLPALVTGYLVWHAASGTKPTASFFKKLGYRTRHEIHREKVALKALMGDFKNIHTIKDAWNAV